MIGLRGIDRDLDVGGAFGPKADRKGAFQKDPKRSGENPDLKTGIPTRKKKDSISCISRLTENAKDGRKRPNGAIDGKSWY